MSHGAVLGDVLDVFVFVGLALLCADSPPRRLSDQALAFIGVLFVLNKMW